MESGKESFAFRAGAVRDFRAATVRHLSRMKQGEFLLSLLSQIGLPIGYSNICADGGGVGIW